jgi:hypothetical protein
MNTLPRLRLYALALRLYPAAFRARYADEMLDTARHESARATHPLRFTASLAVDTLRSILREHLRAVSPTGPGYVAAFALFFTFLLLGVSVVNQQILRRRADREAAIVAKLVSYPWPNEADRRRLAAHILTPEHTVELSSPTFLKRDNLVFAIFYDASGRALGGNATLHGALPQPPQGIFNVIRSQGEDKITWQPQPGIRLALFGLPMRYGGFVLSGKSLIPSEARTARLDSILRWMWAVAMLACAFLALSAKRHTRTPTA